MNETLKKIKSRGYWRVVIRPTTFVEDRIESLHSLRPILDRTSVNLKGWSFPHIDDFRELDKGPDWIGQEIVWGEIHELWRFYQSGQFIHYFAIPQCWRLAHKEVTPSGRGEAVWLEIRDFVARFTEVFEFAARLTFTDAVGDSVHVELMVDNIPDYGLFPPSAKDAGWIPVSQKAAWKQSGDFSSLALAAGAKILALEWAEEFFQVFTPAPSKRLLGEAQNEFLARVSG